MTLDLPQEAEQLQQQPDDIKRLIIKKMVLENFKSYKGRVEVGPFHKSFTSIVGPNGSGKSNVIDALLFVFGFKAKKMRQEKVSGLIHSSDASEQLDYCQVEVHFQEIVDHQASTSAFTFVAGTELVVARHATRSNSSKYTINGKGSSYTEVTALLRQKGIDLDHKRFLILQGEVESISQMKPKAQNEHEDGLLEYLEDIIGTSRYKEPIQEAQLQLEELEQRKEQSLSKVKVSEGEVKGLEGQKNEAEDYLQGENELARVKNQVLQLWIHNSHNQMQKSEQQTTQVRTDLDQYDKQLSDLKAELQRLTKQQDLESKEHDQFKQQSDQCAKKLQAMEQEYIQLEEKKKHLKTKRKKLEKQVEKDQRLLSECEQWLQNHDSDVKKYQGEQEKFQNNLDAAEAELQNIRDSLKGKTEKFQEQMETKKSELVPLNELLNSKRHDINILETEVALLEESSQQGQKQLINTQDQLQEQSILVKEKRKEDQLTLSQLKDSTSQLHRQQNELKLLQQQEGECRENLVQCSQRTENARQSLQAAETRDQLMKVLLEERDSGRLPGIYGRLGELGTIDKRYDVAISSAYMDKLKWIVVDKVVTAERCVKVLKQRNAGRASFIVIERTESVKEDMRTPENVPRLIDVIKTKKKELKKAFYYVVRDTLVADDLDQANRVAFGKQRWKVVTLDGKVIDKAGTMSGGGNKVMRGGMSSRVAEDVKPGELKQLQELKDLREEELRAVRNDIKICELEVERLQKLVPQLDERHQQLTMDIDAAEKLIVTLTERLAELQQADKSGAGTNSQHLKQLAGKRSKIAQLYKEQQSVEVDVAYVQQNIQDLQSKILEIGGDQLRRQNARVKDIQDQLTTAQESIARIQLQKKSQEKNQLKIIKTLQKSQADVVEVDAELESLDEQTNNRQNSAKELQNHAEKAKTAAKEKKVELDAIREQVDAKGSEVDKIRAIRVDVENNLSSWTKSVSENKKRINHWRSEIKELTLTKLDAEMAITLPVYDAESLDEMVSEPLERDLAVLQEKLAAMKPNLTVLEEYRQRNQQYLLRVRDLEAVTAERDAKKATFDQLRNQRHEEFLQGFTQISLKLKEMYQMITLGGNAELELVDSLDPFSEGIIFSVMPPKKSWKNISNLSGGEKTLSSLALVFALHHFKPTPLYVMDEIDAALDFRNVSIIANYIKERTRNAQFVIISLRNNMFELADRLVGIYKTDNCTKSIAINPGQVESAVQSI